MRLSKALSAKVMDLRIRDKLLSEGKITKEQVAEFLTSLPDDSSGLTYTEANEGDANKEFETTP